MTQKVGSRGTYEYLTGYNSNNYNGTASIDGIVIHHWGNDGQNFYNVIAALSGTREASAHYVLQDGLVACIIAPGLRAWHVRNNDYQKVMPGVWDVNSHTIGIECRPEMTAGDLETLCQLIADLWCDYGKVPVYGHKDFMATACPGRYYSQLDYVRKRAQEIMDGNVPMVDQNTPSEWAKDAWDKAHELGLLDGTRPHDNVTREELAAVLVRLSEK